MTTRILLTGATGSFGKAFIAHTLSITEDVELYCMSRDEAKQAYLNKKWAGKPVHWILGDVRNPPALPQVDLVVHAAALKHVGRGELQPHEFVATNVMGSSNILAHAHACDCPMVALSTDKACAPVNAYGATKMLMEKIVLSGGGSLVRYGNVLGSRGSLIPFILQCKQSGAVIPITDHRMTRFWVHLSEAVQYVNEAWTLLNLEGVQGIHVPKAPAMGICTLINALAPGHPTREIGIMPGEKMHEYMINADEAVKTYNWNGRFIITDNPPADASPVEYGFEYASYNAYHLSEDELLKKLENMDMAGDELVMREGPCVSQ